MIIGNVEGIPQFGQFLGFAIGELMIIALFWHAYFSFMKTVPPAVGGEWSDHTSLRGLSFCAAWVDAANRWNETKRTANTMITAFFIGSSIWH